jgi:hypothetical protein
VAATANHFTNWSASLTLVPGTNWITAQSVDFLGNASVLVSNRFFYKVLSPLTVVTDGNGKSSITNNSQLALNVNYTTTATPVLGYYFSNWLASVDGGPALEVSANPKYTF